MTWFRTLKLANQAVLVLENGIDRLEEELYLARLEIRKLKRELGKTDDTGVRKRVRAKLP